MIDLDALSRAVYARIRTDAQGAIVRDALAASGVTINFIRAERLRQPSLPSRPLLAFRDGTVQLIERGHHQPLFFWYILDEPVQGYGRISTLATLIARAYEASPKIQVEGGGVVGSMEVVTIGQGSEDATLNLLVRPVTVALNTT